MILHNKPNDGEASFHFTPINQSNASHTRNTKICKSQKNLSSFNLFKTVSLWVHISVI